jgi:hypothetical protein
MTGSVTCTTVLGISVHISQKQSPDAWSFPLYANAVVALLATAAESTLLMVVCSCISQETGHDPRKKAPRPELLTILDNASRGSIGALQLSLQRAGLGLAGICAIHLLFSVAHDTFAQQAASFEPDVVDARPDAGYIRKRLSV